MRSIIIGIIALLLLFSISHATFLNKQQQEKLQDTVSCNILKNSNSLYPKNCTNSYDTLRPIDVSTTFTYIGNFSPNPLWYGQSDWDYWLEDKSGTRTQIQGTKDCFVNQPKPFEVKTGTDMYLAVKCFSVPRKIQSGDRFVFNVFTNKQHGNVSNLLFYISLNGSKDVQINKESENKYKKFVSKGFPGFKRTFKSKLIQKIN